ncbi:MAG: patatin-like phospholipase family protein [Actinomycetota bacterium]|nr:patatin-like phospholipase family protein [Actinomycetota bacterium]
MSSSGQDGPSKSSGWWTVVLAVAALAAGIALYHGFAPRSLDIVGIELSGRHQPWPLPAGTTRAVWWDFAFIAGYGSALLLGIRTLAWILPADSRHPLPLALGCALMTIGADLSENAFLLIAGYRGGSSNWLTGALLEAASTAAVLKFCTLVPAAAGALAGLVITICRLLSRPPVSVEHPRFSPARPVEGDPVDSERPFAIAADDATRWRNGYHVPGLEETDLLRKANKPVVGICLSGGGIRAAAVAMGAMQSLRDKLIKAHFLVSVSGGGYTAGALQQAITTAGPANPLGAALHDPATAFGFGGVEEDHVRRHSSYLADTTPRLMLALAMIVRHLLLTLVLLFGPAVALGIAGGWFYARVPVTDLSGIEIRAYQPRRDSAASHKFDTAFPDLRLGALIALGLAALVALLCWLNSERSAARGADPRWVRQRLRYAVLSRQFSMVAAAVAVLAIVAPSLAWVAAWLFDQAGGIAPVAIGGPVGTVLFTYLTSLAVLVWRKKKWIGAQVSGLFGRTKSGGVAAAVPSGPLQLVLVFAALLVLAASWLLLFAGLILTDGDRSALYTGAGVTVLVFVLGGIVDETTLSMHPFYRARLASAFAVRTIRREQDGQLVALAYPSAERTTLSRYGVQPPGRDFPRVIFAATANLTGEERTPPGLNAVSYTFNGDWVGGPDVGWVRTKDLEQVSPPRLQRDLTVQGAVALSGAAIASSMGKGARWTQVLMAVTGVRLGAWMPNPRFVIEQFSHPPGWQQARLPQVRRLSYLLRELFDLHRHDGPLLHVTDGGHYENLGLVELFRRRCTRIYCIDSSGDSPPTATTFAEALTLARQELGVIVTLDPPWTTEPGSGAPFDPKDPLSALNARLSASPLITGTFRYPAESGADDVVGQLVVAKALLWPELPYQLLSYATNNAVFPHDSTADQWFDDGQYAAYTELGRQLGTLADSTMDQRING